MYLFDFRVLLSFLFGIVFGIDFWLLLYQTKNYRDVIKSARLVEQFYKDINYCEIEWVLSEIRKRRGEKKKKILCFGFVDFYY